MSYTNGLDKPTDYFNTVLYTGNGSTQSITGINFQPDWVWIKERDDTPDHKIYDVVRGATKSIESNTTEAETTNSSSLTSFDSDGFSLGTNGSTNGSGDLFVSWNWLAGGSASSNTDGTETSTVSANTTAGFSIMTYAGTTAVDTYGHGLSQKPDMILIKRRTLTGNWVVYHKSIGATKHLHLNTTDAENTYQYMFNNTEPTNSLITLSDDGEVNKASSNYVAYVFHSVKGYSKFGSYTGNGSTDGTYIHLGFKAAYIMIKGTGSGTNWFIQDNKRNPHNIVNKYFNADSNAADQSADMFDITANGIKQRNTFANLNGSGSTYIFMAFAENPFVSSGGIPTTAR